MGVSGVCSVSINSFLLGALLLNIHFLGKAEVSPFARSLFSSFPPYPFLPWPKAHRSALCVQWTEQLGFRCKQNPRQGRHYAQVSVRYESLLNHHSGSGTLFVRLGDSTMCPRRHSWWAAGPVFGDQVSYLPHLVFIQHSIISRLSATVQRPSKRYLHYFLMVMTCQDTNIRRA